MVRWTSLAIAALLGMAGSPPSFAVLAVDLRIGNVTLDLDAPFPLNLSQALTRLFPTEQVRVRIRTKPRDKNRTQSLKIWVNGTKLLNQSGLNLPNDSVAAFAVDALWSQRIPLETRVERLRAYLRFIGERSSSEPVHRALENWQARLPMAFSPSAAGSSYWFLLKKHEGDYLIALAGLHEAAPSLKLDLDAEARAFERETGDFLQTLKPANIRSHQLMKQAGFALLSSNLLALAEAVYDAGGHIVVDVSVEPQANNPHASHPRMTLSVRMPERSFAIGAVFTQAHPKQKHAKFVGSNAWAIALSEAIDERIGNAPEAWPLIESNPLFQPGCRWALGDGSDEG